MCELCTTSLAIDVVESTIGTLLMIEKAEDDPIPFEITMLGILSGEFGPMADEFLEDDRVLDLIDRMADPTFQTIGPAGEIQVSEVFMNAFHDLADVELGDDFAAQIQVAVGEELENMYRAARAVTAESTGGVATDAFTLVDQSSINSLKKNNLFWIRENYTHNVTSGIERATAEALQQGLGRIELAADLKRRFAGQFDLTDNHWTTISSASLNRTRNTSQIRTYTLADVTMYTILAVLDRRTSEQCRYMDGRTFTVQSAVRRINELEGSNDPADVKNSMPWLRWDQGRQAPFVDVRGERIDFPSGADSRSDAANATIQDVAPLPPYHGRCRTTTIQSTETVRT